MFSEVSELKDKKIMVIGLAKSGVSLVRFLVDKGAKVTVSDHKSKAELSLFLFTRGLWLAFFEVVVNRAMWMFNYDLHVYGAGVFWAIGWSMIVLSLLVFLPAHAVTVFGVAAVPAITPSCRALRHNFSASAEGVAVAAEV